MSLKKTFALWILCMTPAWSASTKVTANQAEQMNAAIRKISDTVAQLQAYGLSVQQLIATNFTFNVAYSTTPIQADATTQNTLLDPTIYNNLKQQLINQVNSLP